MSQNIAHTPYKQVLPNDYGAYEEQHVSIPVGSSLSVLGGLLSLARLRFYGPPDNSVPYVWTALPNSHMEDTDKSSITIERAGNSDVSPKEKKPVILVDRGVIREESGEMLGSNVGEHRPSGKKLKYSTVTGPFAFICKGYQSGPAEVLANIMFEWLLYNREAIKEFFQFREFGPIEMGKEIPVPKSSDVYECSVNVRISWEHRWMTIPKAVKLSELRMRIYGTDDPTAKLDLISSTDKVLEEIVCTDLVHKTTL